MGNRLRKRVWFTIEAKSFEITVDGVGRRLKYVITERSRGVVAWIRFGEEGVRTLLKGVEACCREKATENWRKDWKEGKRIFKLGCGSNKAGRFLQCMVRDEEGKKHCIFFPAGKGLVNGWSILIEKLKEVVAQEKEEKLLSNFARVGGWAENVCTFAEAAKNQRRGNNTIWMDTGESHMRRSMGTLKNCLVGVWKERPGIVPSVKEVESWAKVVWRLNGGLTVAYLNNDLMSFEFEEAADATYVLEGGVRSFRGGRLNLERWSPDSGCVKRKNQLNKLWVRIVGLPLHLWTCEVLRMIGDGCGGYLDTDEDTRHRTEVLLWARILVKAEGQERPSTVNILAGSRSYEIHIWWEVPPWVAEVVPSKEADIRMQNKEEDEWCSRADHGAWWERKKGTDGDGKGISTLGNGESNYGTGKAVKGAGGTAHRAPWRGVDPMGEEVCSKGWDSKKGRMRMGSRLKEVTDGPSPQTQQLKTTRGCCSSGSGPRAHVLEPGRLKEDEKDGSSLNLISKEPENLPYKRRAEKESGLTLSNSGGDFAVVRYVQAQSFSSTSSPSISDRLLPSGEFFGQEGGQVGEGDCGGSVQIPLQILAPIYTPRCYRRETMVGEEQQPIQCLGGEKVEGGVGIDLVPWEESCLAKFSEFLGFPIEGFKEEILELMNRINSRRQKRKGKGGAVSTKFDRELKKLEWNVMDSGRKKGALGKGVRASYSGVE